LAVFILLISNCLKLCFLCCSNIPTLQEQAVDIPMQMVRGENDEPDVHIGFDEEQQTE